MADLEGDHLTFRWTKVLEVSLAFNNSTYLATDTNITELSLHKVKYILNWVKV